MDTFIRENMICYNRTRIPCRLRSSADQYRGFLFHRLRRRLLVACPRVEHMVIDSLMLRLFKRSRVLESLVNLRIKSISELGQSSRLFVDHFEQPRRQTHNQRSEEREVLEEATAIARSLNGFDKRVAVVWVLDGVVPFGEAVCRDDLQGDAEECTVDIDRLGCVDPLGQGDDETPNSLLDDALELEHALSGEKRPE